MGFTFKLIKFSLRMNRREKVVCRFLVTSFILICTFTKRDSFKENFYKLQILQLTLNKYFCDFLKWFYVLYTLVFEHNTRCG